MDIVFHPGTNGSTPWVEFYPYTPSATAGYAFMAIFGISTVVHFILMFPYRAAHFIPLVLGGVCETFGYYGRAWSHQSRTDIRSWALQEMLILCAPPLTTATIYMALGRIVRALNAEHHSSIRTSRLTFLFVTNDIICFATQLGGAGVQVTGDAHIMDIGKKVVLAGLIFSLIVFVGFVLLVAVIQRRMQREPTDVLIENPGLRWRRYIGVIYVACLAIMVRNLVRTVQFGSGHGSPLNTKEVYIYVFDAFLMFLAMAVLVGAHPGRLVKKVRRLNKVAAFHEPLAAHRDSGEVPLREYDSRPISR